MYLTEAVPSPVQNLIVDRIYSLPSLCRKDGDRLTGYGLNATTLHVLGHTAGDFLCGRNRRG